MNQEPTTSESMPKHYDFDIVNIPFGQNELRVYKLTDTVSGVTINVLEANKDIDYVSTAAWAGARFSRTGAGLVSNNLEIAEKWGENPEFASSKLAEVFSGYGHRSVAGLGHLLISVEGLTIEEAFRIFNCTSLGDGQEFSTRYVNVEDFNMPGLETLVDLGGVSNEKREELLTEWEGLQDFLGHQYNRWQDLVSDRYKDYLTRHLEESGSEKKLRKSTLTSRTLDIARMWLPIGARTAMTMHTSVIGLLDVVTQLREQDSPRLNAIGDQIDTMLNISRYKQGVDTNLSLEGLTKYAEARDTVRDNLDSLRDFIINHPAFHEFTKNEQIKPSAHNTEVTQLHMGAGEAIAFQYISSIFPNADPSKLIEVIKNVDETTKRLTSEIIFKDHNRHDPMRTKGDVRGDSVWIIESAVGYVRDLNRHRAMGRYVDMLETNDVRAVVSNGFNHNYQLGIKPFVNYPEAIKPDFTQFSEAWDEAMSEYYDRLVSFMDKVEDSAPDANLRFIYNLLPLAHQVNFQVSGPATQWAYLLDQRLTPGGDIGYNYIVDLIRTDMREGDPYLAAIASLSHIFNPEDPERLLDRT